jgi:TolB protein
MGYFSLHPNTRSALGLLAGALLGSALVSGLLNLSGTDHLPAPTIDNTIVFMRHDGNDMEIVTIQADGSGEQVLTDNLDEDWAAVWTPDKQQIVFHSNRDGWSAIYIMDRDGSNVRRITPENRFAQFPSVSPDGKWIAFEMYMDQADDWDIFVMPIEGGTPRRITFDPAHDGGAAWSPDGNQIAFHSTRAGYYDIYTVALDGSGLHRLTNFTETMDVWPQWSADGSQILFHSERDGNSEIYIMNADGSHPFNLTQHPGLDRAPRFMPDGQHIVFRSERDGESALYIMHINSGCTQRVTHSTARDLHPDA